MDTALVGIIMGSDSDLPLMQHTCDLLKELQIPFEVTIVSAHRTPERMVTYARQASQKGLKVIIACAGGAAHLPGMTASLTQLPVIGVPRLLPSLSGIDSLLSIAQMPEGIPVATVAIDGAYNAGLLAARIIALSNSTVSENLANYSNSLSDSVLKKARVLEEKGYEHVLNGKK